MDKLVKPFIIICLSVLSSNLFAVDNKYHSMLTYNFGMANISVTETEAGTKATDDSISVEDTSSASSSAVSAMSFQLSYEFGDNAKLRYFVKGTAPLMAGTSTGVFGGDFGFNYYFNNLGSKYTYSLAGNQVTINPTFRYYAGASFGIGYLVYATESATKSDVYFNLGFQGGAIYSFSEKWGVKAELGLGRTTGVTTTGIKVEFFVGASYYL